MKINRIELINFRCFQHSEIDLSADVTAIYGRNGVGKTTIFDALEFALLGSIGRFLNESDKPYYLPHVLSDNDGMIHVDFRNDSEHWIQLNVNRSNFDINIESSGNWRNHRDLLYEFFVNQDYFPPRRDVSTVSELFRSTVLLSQDSIREFIGGDVAKRSRILSYISGSGYIQRCFDKAKAVIEESKKREKQQQVILGEATRMLTETKAKAAEHDAKLIEIRKRSGEVSITHNIVLKALEDAGISIGKVIPQTHEDAEIFSASIKGTTNDRIAILEERTKLLSQIDAISQQHPDRLIRHRELYEMVEQAKKDLVTLLKKENIITEYLKNLDAQISDKKINISENSRNFESFQTLYGFQQQWTDLLNTKAKISEKINQIKQELDLARNRIEKDQGDRDTAKKNVENSITIIEKTSADLENLKALKIVLPTHIASVDKIRQLESLIIDLSQKRFYLQEHAVKLQGQSRKITDEMDILKRKISPMKASLEEATNLITRLKEYVTGSVCPLCGHIHPSEKALQEAIDIKIKDIPSLLSKISF